MSQEVIQSGKQVIDEIPQDGKQPFDPVKQAKNNGQRGSYVDFDALQSQHAQTEPHRQLSGRTVTILHGPRGHLNPKRVK